MSLSAVSVALQIFLFAFAVLNVSGVQKLTITPDKGSKISISNSQAKGSGCTVCYGAKSSQKCGPSALLTDSGAASVEFKCPKPHDVFSVEIIRQIDCNAKSCNGDITQTESGSLPLVDFNRTFTWNLQASKAFQIDFTKTGLRQIDPSESCPDKHTYTLEATGNVAIGKYCRTGTISSAQVLTQGKFSLHVPAKQKLQNAQFDVSVGEVIKTLAKVKVTVPQGTSSSEFFSPNYPDSFPDDDVMEWVFDVPAKHSAAVQILNKTLPQCRKKAPRVEYQSKGRAPVTLRLTDTKPVPTQGSFSLTLTNCEMEKSQKGSPGFSLNFKVPAARTSSPEVCDVDLRKEKGFSLYIEKKRPGSECEMKMNSVTQEKMTVPADRVTQLSFQDCLHADLQVTARTLIACYQLKDCPKPMLLVVPTLPRCLPPLSNVTWTLRSPPHGTVELRSPTGTLRQSLPGHLCNDSMTLKLAEDDGTCLGHFCPQGAIQKIQIHTNMSVTAYSTATKPLQSSSKPVLSASFRDEISDRYIFWASPKKGTPVHLATPGWPDGMKSHSTISWIVTLPPTMCAHLNFTNQSQPKCSNSHTGIKVQSLGSLEEMYSRREDEKADNEITVSKSFYLNMSSCMPETGSFSVLTQITLHKSKSLLLTIILSVVAALLVIFVIVLAVVCVVIRKKKKKMNHEMSIYNPNGTSSWPGPNGLPKSGDGDDESHVYATIEDSLVYTHLLKRGAEMGIYGDFDKYQPFTGPTDPHKPPASKDTDPDDMKVGVYEPFVPPSHQAPPVPNRPPSQSPHMVDNEVYQSADLNGSTELGPRMEPEGGN